MKMIYSIKLIIVACLLFFYFSFVNLSYSYNDITDYDRAKAVSGEIVVKSVKTNDGLEGVQAIFSVNASRMDIWETLIDYGNFQEIFNNIDMMKVVSQNKNGATVEFWANIVIKQIHYVLYRSYDIYGQKISWESISGDIERIEGSWNILDTDDPQYKLLVYDSYVKVGMLLVPEFVARLGALSKAESMAENLRNWIEKKNN